QRDGHGGDRLARHVPGEVATRRQDLTLLTAGRYPAGTAAALRRFAIRPNDLIPDGCSFVAHRPRVALDHESGPRHVWREVLAHEEVHSVAGILDRLDGAGAHRLRDGVEGRTVVLRRRGERCKEQQDGHQGHGDGSAHTDLPGWADRWSGC